MKYRLRSDLTKTVVYMVIKQFAPTGITLPTVRKCDFKKFRGTYWMHFDFDEHRFKAVFDVCLGTAYVSFEPVTACGADPSSVNKDFRRQVVDLPVEYLLNNKLLREVA